MISILSLTTLKEYLTLKLESPHHLSEWKAFEKNVLLKWRCQLTIALKLIICFFSFLFNKEIWQKQEKQDSDNQEFNQCANFDLEESDNKALHYIAAIQSIVVRILLLIASFKFKNVSKAFFYNEMLLHAVAAFILNPNYKSSDVMLTISFLVNLIDFACLYTLFAPSLMCATMV